MKLQYNIHRAKEIKQCLKTNEKNNTVKTQVVLVPCLYLLEEPCHCQNHASFILLLSKPATTELRHRFKIQLEVVGQNWPLQETHRGRTGTSGRTKTLVSSEILVFLSNGVQQFLHFASRHRDKPRRSNLCNHPRTS